MRITGGVHRGRVLKVPEGMEVRPTQDRVREALFNILMHDIAGARFLDLFAGSGAVGLEALSRGATSATFVELNARHISFIKANATQLKIAPEIVQADAYRYISDFSGYPFDIVHVREFPVYCWRNAMLCARVGYSLPKRHRERHLTSPPAGIFAVTANMASPVCSSGNAARMRGVRHNRFSMT